MSRYDPKPNVCDVCGHDISKSLWPDSDSCPWCYPEEQEKPPAATGTAKSPGLDAAGFLLNAQAHLGKAQERLDQEPPSKEVYWAKRATIAATNYVRLALEHLDEQKEETCREP